MYDVEQPDEWTGPAGDQIHDQQFLQKQPKELHKKKDEMHKAKKLKGYVGMSE